MTFPVPADPDALLTRKHAAEALTTRGYPTSERTLSTKASRGGGPLFRHFGPRVLYRWGDLIDWAEGRLSAPRRSTSEAATQLTAR
jgi:hypothetical protein